MFINMTTDRHSNFTTARNVEGLYFGAYLYSSYIHIFGGSAGDKLHDMVKISDGTVQAATALPVAFNRSNGDFIVGSCIFIRSAMGGNNGNRYYGYSSQNSVTGTFSEKKYGYDNGAGGNSVLFKVSYNGRVFSFYGNTVYVNHYIYQFFLPKGYRLIYPATMFVVGQEKVEGQNFYTYKAKDDGIVTIAIWSEAGATLNLNTMETKNGETVVGYPTWLYITCDAEEVSEEVNGEEGEV